VTLPSPSRRQLHGRRKGHALRPGRARLLETLLPRLRLDLSQPLAGLEPPVWIEIGFGGGEHLAHEASRHPDRSFIGAEVFVNGIARLLSLIEAQGLTNIRIHDGDARVLLEALPDGCARRIDLLYPDPWPKLRHHKRRFVNAAHLGLMQRVLTEGGELLFATDIEDYLAWTIREVVAQGGFRPVAPPGPTPPEGWIETRYEAKARREGRKPRYLLLERV
jgi:tRNA (guanine-N7-)-methyltransferase